jgi:hypothetical protein
MRCTLGTAVFFGTLGVTLFGIFLTLVFFYVIRGLTRQRTPTPAAMTYTTSPDAEVKNTLDQSRRGQ